MGWRDNAQAVYQAPPQAPEPDWKQGAQTVLPEPDMAPTQKMIEDNLAKAQPQAATSGDTQAPQQPQAKQAQGFKDALEAGFGKSVTGLIAHGHAPDVVLPENAPWYYRIASQVGELAGDLPAMAAGSVAGSAAGTAVAPVAGTAIGAGAGAFALPEALRTIIMQHYQKGDVQNFQDFWERASATFINTLKAGVIGGATAGVGGAVEKVVGETAASSAIKSVAKLSSEVATMTTVGSALNGKVPSPSDFFDAAIMVGGMHAVSGVTGKLMGEYAKTGVSPTDIAQEAQQNPAVKQHLLADNNQVPLGTEPGQMTNPEAAIPKAPEIKPKNTEYSDATNTIMSKISDREKPPTDLSKEGIKQAVTNTFNKLYTDYVDKTHPVKLAVDALHDNPDALPAEKNPLILTRMVPDATARAATFIEKHTFDYKTTEATGKSYLDIYKSVPNADVLDAYAVSKRVIELEGQGKKTGFDLEAAKKVVEEHKAQYEEASQDLKRYQDSVTKYLLDSGVISKDKYDAFLEGNDNYIHFKRLMETAGGGLDASGVSAGSLKEFKGGDQKILTPSKAIMENTETLIKLAETNRPKVALVEMAEANPDQTLMKKVAGKGSLRSNQFEVFRNGEREVWQTTPELAEVFQKLGGDVSSQNFVLKLMRGITAYKKAGITFTAEFISKNSIRDWFTAGSYTDGKGVSPLSVAGAMRDIWDKNDTYWEWMKSGGANGAFLDLNDTYIKSQVFKLQKETNFMNSMHNLVVKPIEALKVASELAEQSTRLSEFKKVRARGGSLTEAGYAAREITVDFQRIGAKMSAFNSITAFMNPNIQGVDRMVRAFKDDPAGTTTKAMAAITAPSILLWWANKDDERVKQIPSWQKDVAWIFALHNWVEATPGEADGLADYLVKQENGKVYVDKGHIWRIPKPQELGMLFGSFPERILDKFFTDHPEAMKDFDKSVMGILSPNFVPDAISPIAEQYMNKSFFTGRDIIPGHLEKLMPEDHYVDYTSETAKTLGKMIGRVAPFSEMGSPVVIDNYIQSWGGSLGKYALQTSDFLLRKSGVVPDIPKAADTVADIPFIKAFAVRYPQSGAKAIQDFYDQSKQSDMVLNSIEKKSKEGDVDGANRLIQQYPDVMRTEGIKKGLSAQAQIIRNVNKDPTMSPDEKRQMIDGAYLQMIEIAKQGNILLNSQR